jgi:hypothetical protein
MHSTEHSKTELQRLDQPRSQISVREITLGNGPEGRETSSQLSKAEEPGSTQPMLSQKASQERSSTGRRQADESRQAPRVLKFCRNLSTAHIDISVSGKSSFSSDPINI